MPSFDDWTVVVLSCVLFRAIKLAVPFREEYARLVLFLPNLSISEYIYPLCQSAIDSRKPLILDGHQVQLPVGNTEAYRATRLRHNNDWASPFPSGGFHDPHRAHALDFSFLCLPGQRPGLVGVLRHGDSPGPQPNAMFHTA